MGAISAMADAWIKVAKTARMVANLGAPQLIKQLDALRSNLEQFKEAARKNDTSKMRQLLAECEEESKFLEKRLFKKLDDKTHKALNRTVRRARSAKSKMAKKVRPHHELRKALKAKSAKLASELDVHDEASRQELLDEIDIAIGKLKGISISLASFTL